MRINYSSVISTIGLILSLFVLWFGDNISEHYFLSTKLLYDTYRVEMKFPQKVDEAIKEFSLKNQPISVPKSLRVMEIINHGNTSKNLNVYIQTDGEIIDFNAESPDEKINSSSIVSDKLISLSMDKLAKNAKINVKIWMGQGSNENFKVKYTDEKQNKYMTSLHDSNGVANFIKLSSLLLLILCIYMLQRYFNKRIVSDGKKIEEIQKDREKMYNVFLTSKLEEVGSNNTAETTTITTKKGEEEARRDILSLMGETRRSRKK